ncbi:MAG: SLATT domain-containing protein [Oscillospiraceae bacterium]|nr:SLATT domain-containing protein [Oscillospiraceae bacterium]
MDEGFFDKFKNQVWTTRQARIKAEKRLEQKEMFIQFVNIYYSCFTIIFSLVSYVLGNDWLSLISLIMTISLLAVILFFNSMRFKDTARQFRENYTLLQKIEFELQFLSKDNIAEVRELQIQYCDLMNAYNNHTSFDYYCAVAEFDKEDRDKVWNKIWKKYYWGCIWRVLVKILIVVFPIVLPLFGGGM